MFYERGYTCVGLLKDRSFVFGSNLMMDFEVNCFVIAATQVAATVLNSSVSSSA